MRPTPPRQPTGPRPSGVAVALLLVLVSSAVAQVEVAAPDMAAARGTAVTLPIHLANPAPDKVVAVEVTVAFDSDVLTYQGLSSAGALTAAWLLDSVLVEAGIVDTLRVAAATATDTAFGAGDLFQLDFQVADLRDPTVAQVTLSYVLLNDGSPVATANHGSVTLTGTDGLIGATPDTAFAGQTVQVSISDIDENRTGGVDAVLVHVTNGAQQETLSAPETGASTGVFALAVPLVASGSQPSGDQIVQVQAGDQLSLCYDDVLDVLGATVERCTTVEITGATFGVDGSTIATYVVEPGDTAWVRVTDPDLNVDSGATEVVTVSVENAATGETESVTLTEIGDDSDVFLGRFYTAYGTVAGAAGDALVLTQKGDALRVEYSDFGTVSGSAEIRTVDVLTLDPFGDASGNGTVRGFDAALILDHSVGAIVLTGLDSLAANLDLAAPAGPITAFDASLILQLRVGLLDRFPVRERASANHPQPETGTAPRPAALARWATLVAGGDGQLALVLDERSGIVAADLLVSGFAGHAVASPEAGQFVVVSRQTSAGLRIALAAATASAGPGELVRLVPNGAAATPELVSAQLNDGSLPVRLGVSQSATAVPARFELLPNHPNPFNPETAIRFQTARAGQVELDILNPLGQRVRRVADRWHEAGAHRVQWDGRDDAGAPVAGGIYFYRLVTPTHQAVRKMTLLK